MKVAAGMMVKDEADVILQTIEHLRGQGIDHFYVMDNGSTDGTWEILAGLLAVPQLQQDMTLFHDSEVGYYQSRKMTDLQRRAHGDGFQWFVPCDADELWSGESEFDTVREVLDAQPGHVGGVYARLYDHYATGRDDMQEPDPFKRLVWRVPVAQALPKVAVRTDPRVVIEMGNHGAFVWEMGWRSDLTFAEGLRIDHFPYRSADQFISKARNGSAAYRAAPDLPESAGVHWRAYGDILARSGEAGLRAHFREHFYYPEPEAELVKDPRYARAA